MTTQKINDAQMSLPSTTFGTDMRSMMDMGSSMPQSVMTGAINDHMSGQMDNTMSDMMSYPDQAGAFKSNGIDSMVQGVSALHEGDSLDSVSPDTWTKMSGFGSEMSNSLGFDPSQVAGGDLSAARQAFNATNPVGFNPNAPSNIDREARFQQFVASGAGQTSNDGVSQMAEQMAPQAGLDATHSLAKGAAKLGKFGVETQAGIIGAETEMAGKLAGGAVDAGKGVLKTEAKMAGKAADVGEDAVKMGSKAMGGLADLAKSPAGKMLGKAALPLGLVGGAVSLASDAGTFGDALTDPFNTEKLGKARDALREDLPIPGAPLVIDAVTDPGKILDAGKDIGKAITHPSMDNLKDAGSKVLDELGF